MATHHTDPRIRAAATAIANARAQRRGVPAVENVLDILNPRLVAEVMEDAELALEAADKFTQSNPTTP